MTIVEFYLYPTGRINAKEFWFKGFFPIILLFFLFPVLVSLLNLTLGIKILSNRNFESLNIIWLLFIAWVEIAVVSKRWHDINKSAWWSLIGLIPIVGGLWILVECGLQRGVKGDNRFGPDPSIDNKGWLPENRAWKRFLWFLYIYPILLIGFMMLGVLGVISFE